jgi:hypothetical protein
MWRESVMNASTSTPEEAAANIHPNAALYCQLMELLKWRTGAVIETLDRLKKRNHYFDNRLAAEFCMLQLRMCCELLAIGCVAIHTDVATPKQLHKEWNADSIMKKFARLKPKFFPQPIVDKRGTDGIIDQIPREGALNREELLKHYHLFGGMLHSGALSDHLAPTEENYNLSMFDEFIAKLGKLLSNHTYLLNDERTMIRVIMNNEVDGRVWMNLLSAQPGPADYSGDSIRR